MEELVLLLLGSISDEAPARRALAVGFLAWVVVEFAKRKFSKDEWYGVIALATGAAVNMGAAAMLGQHLGWAFLHGLIMGAVPVGLVSLYKKFQTRR